MKGGGLNGLNHYEQTKMTLGNVEWEWPYCIRALMALWHPAADLQTSI